jgi:aspartate racemase
MQSKQDRKKLAILGGMGPEATEVFYKKIIDSTQVSKDSDHLDILIYNHATMPDRTEYILGGREDELWEILKKDIDMLKTMGGEYLAIPCNTCHYFADRINEEADGNFINMIKVTAQHVKDRGSKVAGILATDGTCTANLYGKAMEELGLKVVYPSEEKQKDVMDLIYNQIKQGEKGDRKQFLGVVKELRDLGCDTIVLACTELSVFYTNHDLNGDFYVDALDELTRACIINCGGTYCE